jgi:hypothetical protein
VVCGISSKYELPAIKWSCAQLKQLRRVINKLSDIRNEDGFQETTKHVCVTKVMNEKSAIASNAAGKWPVDVSSAQNSRREMLPNELTRP